ncbi:MAG: hypothetical protein AB1298_06250 [Bacteroidota bacterium]
MINGKSAGPACRISMGGRKACPPSFWRDEKMNEAIHSFGEAIPSELCLGTPFCIQYG